MRERDVGGRIARGLALIPEDRQRDGLVAILSVAENLTMASLGKLTRYFHIQARAEAEVVRTRSEEPVNQGGGPRFAGFVAVRRKSAESGDRQGAAHVAEGPAYGRAEPRHRHRRKSRRVPTMRRLAAQGLGIVFVTSDLDEVLALSDRIAVMSQGTLDRLVRSGRRHRSQDCRRVLRRPCSRARRRGKRSCFHDRRCGRRTALTPGSGRSL